MTVELEMKALETDNKVLVGEARSPYKMLFVGSSLLNLALTAGLVVAAVWPPRDSPAPSAPTLGGHVHTVSLSKNMRLYPYHHNSSSGMTRRRALSSGALAGSAFVDAAAASGARSKR